MDLSSRLVLNGVDVRLDRWNVSPGESLTEFMEVTLQECEAALVVCTPNYASRSTKRRGGVGYEQQIISGQIASGAARSKFIPIVRSGSFNPSELDCAIPPHFLGINTLDFRGDIREEVFEDLLRAIFKRPRLRPPELGQMPNFDSDEQDLKPCRLATIEIERWHLLSGVVRNEASPKTFYIPTERERRSVGVGDVVKLTFEFAPDEDDKEDSGPYAERMWVEVTGSNGPYFLGNLRNQPASFVYANPQDENDVFVDEEAPLTYNSEVVFLPEHIIDIERER